jgi:pheromone a factor receptor
VSWLAFVIVAQSHWPIVMNIYLFYTRERRFREIMSATPGLTRNRYIRLMAVSAADIMGTIPLASFYLVKDVQDGIVRWKGWADTHEDYSAVYQIPASIWKNDPDGVLALEMFRWSLVLCAFLFFALFGFADEARRHYRCVYTSIVNRIGHSTSVLQRSSHGYAVHLIYGLIATHGYSQFLFSVLHLSPT